eukprot:TRINITY_DN30480_c0_g1_i1.p1 TRINITY_DN30480_c0_g1~~TRINITY_DN30480_c0_g1_i1.p1  ORF type:complete len:488 (-),score=82.32 TRINITY_DN30480_c0_g1_i1:155-1618(-)
MALRRTRQEPSSVPKQEESPRGSGASLLGDMLASQLRGIAEAVLEQDAAINELRREARRHIASGGNGPADVGAVYTEQNAALARHTQEGLAEAAALASANGALTGEAEVSRQRVKELRAELDLLRTRVAAAEQLEDGACRASELAERALDAERQKGEYWFEKLEDEIGQRTRRVTESEKAAAEARSNNARLESELKACHENAQASIVGHDNGGPKRSHQVAHEARAEASQLRETLEQMEAALEASENSGKETERKVICIARELSETSDAIKQLRSEAEEHRDLRMELDQARREEGYLEERLRGVVASVSSTLPTSANVAFPARSGKSDIVAHSQQLKATLQDEHALYEALRTAWESEARDKRAAELHLKASEAQWTPLRQWLTRLSAALRHGHNELARGGAPLPEFPPDDAWTDLSKLPSALASLCNCAETLARGSMDAAEGLQLGPTGRNASIDVGAAHCGAGAWPNIGDVSSLSPSSPALSRGYP